MGRAGLVIWRADDGARIRDEQSTPAANVVAELAD
jgi:hypothetical protein